MSPFVVGQALFTTAGVLMIALGIPLIRRKIRPNALYGLRTRTTLADEVVWYRANALLGRWQTALGASLLALGWLVPLVPGISAEAYVLSVSGWLVIGVLAMCVGTQVAARRMAERRRAEAVRNG